MSEVTMAASIVIDAPRLSVWDELERIEDHVQWMRDADAIRFVGERRRGVEAAFECDTRVGPIRLTDVMEITGWDPGWSMSVRHQGLISGSGRFSLEDRPASATAILWEERLRFPWWLGGPVGARVARPLLVRLWRGNLGRFRARVAASKGRGATDLD